MLSCKQPFTVKEAKEHLVYDAETGIFQWIAGKKKGKIAGSLDGRGYVQICFMKNVVKAHRLAWLFVHGEWPSHFIDHINHVTTDNRICNLRNVDRNINSQNQVKANCKSSSGYLGVKSRKDSGRFEARIHVDGKRHQIGTFGTAEEAHFAYVQAKRMLHAGCVI